MKRRCSECKHFLKGDFHHRACRKCRKKLKDLKHVESLKQPKIQVPSIKKENVVEVKPESERIVYQKKKGQCGYCEDMAILEKTKKSLKLVCTSCKKWLEDMQYLPDMRT